MTVLLRRTRLVLTALLEMLIDLLSRSRRTCGLLLTPGFEAARWEAGRWRAVRVFERARRQVPAYRRYLAAHPAQHVPETDKRTYIEPNRLEDLCRGGTLPRRGVVLDESSGSSGTPTNWVRGPAERRATAQLLRATFVRGLGEGERQRVGGRGSEGNGPVVALNAFALGAWATGLTVTMSLADVCRMKSTGPDRDKVIGTIRQLGRDYRYVVLGYPPFLKDVADDPRIDLAMYDVTAGFGGEGLSESMRTYLLRSYRRVIGSYGASDLEINIAAETEFTIALRRELQANEGLREALVRRKPGVLPMIFQYNPLDYVIESNRAGELLVTVCRASTLSPRVRYNIHDVGHVIRMREVRPLLRRHGAAQLVTRRMLDLPLLLHYGRSDASVDFYGAVVTPDGLREVLYEHPDLAQRMREFRMLGYEDAAATKRLAFAVELQPGCDADDLDQLALGRSVIKHLAASNGDFANACSVAGSDAQPTLQVYAAGTGPFADADRLKYRYVTQVDAAGAQHMGLPDHGVRSEERPRDQ